VKGTHATVDAWVIRKDKAATIILTNLAMPRHPIQTELVNLRLSGAPAPRTAWIERIDEDHSQSTPALADHGRTGILERVAS
jgi:xylan 1,4-beta-xylosidase